MNNHELKVVNTKKLAKTLLTACFIVSTYNLLSTDNVAYKDELPPFTVSTETIVKPHSENKGITQNAPIVLEVSLSLKIDFGERLNNLVRGFIGSI